MPIANLVTDDQPTKSTTRRRRGVISTYDFRRPSKFSRDHLRALQIVADTYARQLSTVFATTLRIDASSRLELVEQCTYEEFESRLTNPGCLTVISLDPLPGFSMLAVQPKLALAIVERLVGGVGSADEARALTEIERGLMRSVTQHVLEEFASAFNIVAVTPSIVAQESNPTFAQIAKPSDMTVVITVSTKVGLEEGEMLLCLPWGSLQDALNAHVAKSSFGDSRDREALQFRETIDTALRDVPVEIAVRFHEVLLTSGDVISLQVGDVVSLHHPVAIPLVGLVDDVPCFTAITGRKGKKLACLVVGLTDGATQ
ncbi:MAG: flagellar motor switch protein FliM [Acidimicrobiia bacterium]